MHNDKFPGHIKVMDMLSILHYNCALHRTIQNEILKNPII